MLLSVNGKVETRAFTSETYGRIWDIDVVNAMEKIVEKNPSWRNPPAKTTNGNVNAGLYASDRDIFLFMVDEDHRIEVKGESLSRGFFVWNSEVGKSSFGLMTFLYRHICGNHIVWGASDVKEIRVRHSQNAPLKAFSQVLPQLNRYVESSAVQETEVIKKAIEYHPAKNKVDMVLWLGTKGFKKAAAEKAYDKAVTEEGNGTSLWNIIQGITAIARNKAHIDTRVELERKAGSMLQMVS